MLYLVALARPLGVADLPQFRLPCALPSIFGGLKVGIGQAGDRCRGRRVHRAERGLGYLQIVSSSRLETSLLFGAVAVISMVGLGMFSAARGADRAAGHAVVSPAQLARPEA